MPLLFSIQTIINTFCLFNKKNRFMVNFPKRLLSKIISEIKYMYA